MELTIVKLKLHFILNYAAFPFHHFLQNQLENRIEFYDQIFQSPEAIKFDDIAVCEFHALLELNGAFLALADVEEGVIS